MAGQRQRRSPKPSWSTPKPRAGAHDRVRIRRLQSMSSRIASILWPPGPSREGRRDAVHLHICGGHCRLGPDQQASSTGTRYACAGSTIGLEVIDTGMMAEPRVSFICPSGGAKSSATRVPSPVSGASSTPSRRPSLQSPDRLYLRPTPEPPANDRSSMDPAPGRGRTLSELSGEPSRSQAPASPEPRRFDGLVRSRR